jgi:hypothetical protein
LSICTVEYQTTGASGHGLLALWHEAAAGELGELAQLLGLLGARLGLRQLVAHVGQLLLQLVVLPARLEGLVEPVDEVTDRLQGAVGALFERSEDRGHDALHAVQGPARPLAVVEAQQRQGEDDEQQQNRPPPAYLLAIHVRRR